MLVPHGFLQLFEPKFHTTIISDDPPCCLSIKNDPSGCCTEAKVRAGQITRVPRIGLAPSQSRECALFTCIVHICFHDFPRIRGADELPSLRDVHPGACEYVPRVRR